MADVTAAIVEYIDPDWRDHFREVDEAFEFYQMHSRSEFRRAYYEVTGDEWNWTAVERSRELKKLMDSLSDEQKTLEK